MAGVAVTEPDFGSDVAGIIGRGDPRRATGDWLIRGTKTWSTFAARADVLMLLARTDPDRSARAIAACRSSWCPRRGPTARASS